MFQQEKQLIVVYNEKEVSKIAVDQLVKLVSQKDDDNGIVGTKDGEVSVIPMEEKAFIADTQTDTLKDKRLFIGNVHGASDIKPIAEVKFEEYGVEYGFAGPQAVLTVDPAVLKDATIYNQFLEKLNAITFQKISAVPMGKEAFKYYLMKGVNGFFKRKNDLMKQQYIYGVTKLYYDHLNSFLES